MYHHELGFLTSVNEQDIFIRTSTETRTFQVAGGVLVGMDPSMATKTFPVTTQPSPVRRPRPYIGYARANFDVFMNFQIDSIPPRYPCPRADAIRSAFQAVPAWTDHLAANTALKTRLDATLGTAGLDAWASWCELRRPCRSAPSPPAF